MRGGSVVNETRLNLAPFNRVLQQYMEVSKRDRATILNTKGFFIARRATVETQKANRQEIKETLKTGRILGMMINKRRGEKGLPGLYGDAMKDEVQTVLAARLRSIAFLKSGWLEAIKTLEPFAERRGVPRQDRSGKRYGRPKGEARPAKTGTRSSARIVNAASAKRDFKRALEVFGGPALQKAFDHEVRSMRDYMARKHGDSARKLGIRTR